MAAQLSGGAIAPLEALEVIDEVCEGLSAAHAAGIVHRDLKPASLLVPLDGPIKIMDFGLARPSDASLTRAGERRGTLAYMAPERLRCAPTDGRADVWAVGAVLYELLTGRRAFPGHCAHEVLHAVFCGPPPALGSLGFPDAVDEVVVRALQRDAERRYPTIDALRADLARAKLALEAGEGVGGRLEDDTNPPTRMMLPMGHPP